MFLRSFAIILTFLCPPAVLHAQEDDDDQGDDDAPGECADGLCGTPKKSGGGGGGGGGGGSVLVAQTDLGVTYHFSDDYDGDGIEDDFDICAFKFDPEQLESDGDGIGDVCDLCAGVYDPDQLDTDGNGEGDACDDDLDGDSFTNDKDNCPFVPNPTQNDRNGNGLGNVCDPLDRDLGVDDEDQDGIADIDDNCPGHNNPGQSDLNGDGRGDACDVDRDADGILNHFDNCPDAVNQDQLERDRDGLGDACDPHFCLVVDQDILSDCLDPKAPFRVHAGPRRDARTGEQIGLGFFANRENELIQFAWSVVLSPNGSRAVPINARSSTQWSSNYQYGFRPGLSPGFTPDLPGRYELVLTARRPRAASNERSTSGATLILDATGNPVDNGGCATVPQPGTKPLIGPIFGPILNRR